MFFSSNSLLFYKLNWSWLLNYKVKQLHHFFFKIVRILIRMTFHYYQTSNTTSFRFILMSTLKISYWYELTFSRTITSESNVCGKTLTNLSLLQPRECRLRWYLLLNIFPHFSQICWVPSLRCCSLKWLLNCFRFFNSFSQKKHRKPKTIEIVNKRNNIFDYKA